MPLSICIGKITGYYPTTGRAPGFSQFTVGNNEHTAGGVQSDDSCGSNVEDYFLAKPFIILSGRLIATLSGTVSRIGPCCASVFGNFVS